MVDLDARGLLLGGVDCADPMARALRLVVLLADDEIDALVGRRCGRHHAAVARAHDEHIGGLRLDDIALGDVGGAAEPVGLAARSRRTRSAFSRLGGAVRPRSVLLRRASRKAGHGADARNARKPEKAAARNAAFGFDSHILVLPFVFSDAAASRADTRIRPGRLIAIAGFAVRPSLWKSPRFRHHPDEGRFTFLLIRYLKSTLSRAFFGKRNFSKLS